MSDIYTFLATHNISYERFDHEAVFTCEESSALPPMPGAPTKNLFLRDKKGRRHFLIVVGHESDVDLKRLRTLLDADSLSFASPERLKEYLGVEPGSATLLGLITDIDHRIEVTIDETVWHADAIQCHPMINTGTLVIPHESMERFLQATGHAPHILAVPQKTASGDADASHDSI